MQKICKKHGLTEYGLRKYNAPKCKKCMVEYVIKHRRNKKAKAVAYKGGKCINPECNYNKCQNALEFHHINGQEDKDYSISSTSPWLQIKNEIDKCILVCSNCHREIHAGLHDITIWPSFPYKITKV